MRWPQSLIEIRPYLDFCMILTKIWYKLMILIEKISFYTNLRYIKICSWWQWNLHYRWDLVVAVSGCPILCTSSRRASPGPRTSCTRSRTPRSRPPAPRLGGAHWLPPATFKINFTFWPQDLLWIPETIIHAKNQICTINFSKDRGGQSVKNRHRVGSQL